MGISSKLNKVEAECQGLAVSASSLGFAASDSILYLGLRDLPVSSSIKRLLQRPHILMLFQINPVIGKEDIEAVQIKPHGEYWRVSGAGQMSDAIFVVVVVVE